MNSASAYVSVPNLSFACYRQSPSPSELTFFFPFPHAAYTSFTYTQLTTNYTDKSPGSQKVAPGGASGLYSVVATVTATITNSGPVTGAEVAQLYIGLPSSAPASPPKQLRGFQKLSLAPGKSGTVTFQLRRKDLSYWDVGAQKWMVPEGRFAVFVGASSRDIRLEGMT